MTLDVHPGPGDRWRISLALGDRALPVMLPKSRHAQLGTSMAPLVQDITAWLDSIDFGAQTRLAHTLEAWLVSQGRTENQMVTLRQHPCGILVGEWTTNMRAVHRFWVPDAILQVLAPDLQSFWTKHPTPIERRRDTYFANSDFNPRPKTENRDFNFALSVSRHARMELISSIPEVLRGCACPDPILF